MSGPLTYIFNLSISTGEIPDIWKHKRVSPIHKSGSKLKITHYRPVSIQPIALKLLEQIIQEQLYKFLSENGVINSKQSGFRRSHSTATATIDVTDYILKKFSEGNLVGVVFIDLAKAFDTVDHKILLSKLNHYGIRDNEYNWFKSYLSDRYQVTLVNDTQSEEHAEEPFGVPQGYVLGPLLFLCYINDLNDSIQCVSHLYADDTVLLCARPDAMQLNTELNEELVKVTEWLASNKLTLNTKKTQYMIFGSKRKLKKITTFELRIKEDILERVNTFKYLGLHFDPTLTWTNHIKITAAKLCTKLGKIERALPFLTVETKKLLLNTLVTPYIDYCSEIWSSASNSNLARIERLYQRVLSILSPEVESETSLRDRLHRNIAIMTFKSTNGMAPIYLQEKFTLVNQIHRRNTRSYDFKKIFVTRSNNRHEMCTFKNRATKIWNDLPGHITSLNSILSFKNELRSFYQI